MASRTTLSFKDEPLPSVQPNLMPFRINHSGPAPVSTYFLKRPIQTSSNPPPTSKNEPNTESAEVHSAENKSHELEAQYSAAFRGRRVVSHNVRLPSDYVGLLLEQKQTSNSSIRQDAGSGSGATTVKKATTKASDRAKALKEKATAKLNKSGKRKSKYFQDEEEAELQDEGNEGLDDGNGIAPNATETSEGPKLVKEEVITVAGKFEGFTLWHPDGPVDQGRDEYIRSLNEWITLAEEIHRV